ncbi:SGNH/GDSL hydrolase family protein [Haloferula rosea]|uniref:SGNH hydrolase-type esterase domain-containing protein n=1 Tax=Haloferula rosea TaxID=490093 RepID=A0A934R9G9_9BACT|nr:GDSL-type esterase/lipase family protein [Haloferula rosea]MBK1827654.1 hypothetical protein [Haloferula rosea]
MMRFLPALAVLLSCLVSAAASPEGDEDRKTVVCFGDSITKRGYPEILGETLGVNAVMAGVAGHSSAAGLRRMKKDVLDQEPDVVVVFFGTNDARVDAPRVHVPVKQYQANLEKIVDACREIGAKVVVCTLPPIDEKIYYTRHESDLYEAAGGIPKLWQSYRQAAIQVAKGHNLTLVDLNQELESEPGWLSKDGVHPSPAGTRKIAALISAAVKPLIEEES